MYKYNSEQPPPPPPPQAQQQLMAPPRMSFSNDFALEPPPPSLPRPPGRADADFEFSPAGSRPMMDADQLFSKGRILPLREAARPPTTTTLRDELRLRAPEADRGHHRGPRWKDLLGLKRAHAQHKKQGAAAADAHVDLGEHGEAEAGE